jgi:hypothetical protein
LIDNETNLVGAVTEGPGPHVCERRLHLRGDDLKGVAKRLLLPDSNLLVKHFLDIVEIVALLKNNEQIFKRAYLIGNYVQNKFFY